MRRVDEQKNNTNILTPLSKKKKKKLTMKNLVKKNVEIENSWIKCSQVISQASELGRIALRRNI